MVGFPVGFLFKPSNKGTLKKTRPNSFLRRNHFKDLLIFKALLMKTHLLKGLGHEKRRFWHLGPHTTRSFTPDMEAGFQYSIKDTPPLRMCQSMLLNLLMASEDTVIPRQGSSICCRTIGFLHLDLGLQKNPCKTSRTHNSQI